LKSCQKTCSTPHFYLIRILIMKILIVMLNFKFFPLPNLFFQKSPNLKWIHLICMFLFHVQIYHMAKVLVCTFCSLIVEPFKVCPNTTKCFLIIIINFYYKFLTIQFCLWPLFLFASFLCSTFLRMYIGVPNFNLVWVNSNWYVRVQQAHGSFHVTCLWIEIVCYR
jgi:hypothetical protein